MLCIPLCFIHPIQSKALSCVEIKEPVLDQYDAAIVGTVSNVKYDMKQTALNASKETKKFVSVDVEKSWKKQVDAQLVFEADGTWAHDFEEGKKYVIYLMENEGDYYNNPCSPVKLVQSSKDYERLLGEGQKPKEAVNSNNAITMLVTLGLAIFLLTVSLLFIWKRKKTSE